MRSRVSGAGWAVTVALACVVATRVSPVFAQSESFFTILIEKLIGQHAEDAQDLAHATVAATRDPRAGPEDERPVALGGLIGVTAQSVDRSHALRLTWHGGRAPFQIAITPASGDAPPRALTACTRFALLDLTGAPAGRYRLSIDAANDAHLSLPLTLVEPSSVPPPPATEAALTEEQTRLLQAASLLMGDDRSWHLEALSRLQALADVQGNSVAKSILSPAP